MDALTLVNLSIGSVLEMQVFLAELLANFSFALPDDVGEAMIKPRYTTTLGPVLANGEAAAPLVIARIGEA